MKKNKIIIIPHSSRNFAVDIEYSQRKRLSLAVYPSQRIVAKVPFGVSDQQLNLFLNKRSAWMNKHIRHFEAHPPEAPKYYIENEQHKYLGKLYALKLTRAVTPAVQLENGILEVSLKHPEDPMAVKTVLNRWYRGEAVHVLTPWFHEKTVSLKYLHLPKPSLRFYRMKRRWGSCTVNRVITLNTELIKHAPESIEYVIIHELCHLKVPAHNKAFYALLESILPDWKQRRKMLNGK